MANDELSFHVSVDDAITRWDSPPNLIYASGSLMYADDPIGKLRERLEIGAPWVTITRTGLSDDMSTRFIVQKSRLSKNGLGPLPRGYRDRIVQYPETFVLRVAFEEACSERYEIRVA